MKLTNKTILLISPEAWGSNFVSKHHYATTLAVRGNRIFFLNPPGKRFGIKNIDKNLFVLDYRPSWRGLARMPDWLSARIIAKEIQKLEKFCGVYFDIIWNFDSSRFFNLQRLAKKLRISHIVDLSEDKNPKLLCTTADLCLASTDFILERQKRYSANAFKLGHGVATVANPKLVKLAGANQRVKAGYLGNLLIRYLDWELIHRLVTSHPHVDFYFAGPAKASNLSNDTALPEWLGKAQQQPNTYFIGELTAAELPSFLQQMDVLLLTYQAHKYKEQLANPHKLLEYLASGKVVVASWTDEYKDKRHLLEMVENNEHLPAKFKEVVANLAQYNSPEKQQARQAWALQNTYEKQIERIETIINNLNKV